MCNMLNVFNKLHRAWWKSGKNVLRMCEKDKFMLILRVRLYYIENKLYIKDAWKWETVIGVSAAVIGMWVGGFGVCGAGICVWVGGIDVCGAGFGVWGAGIGVWVAEIGVWVAGIDVWVVGIVAGNTALSSCSTLTNAITMAVWSLIIESNEA